MRFMMLYEFLLKHSSYRSCPRDYSYNSWGGGEKWLFRIWIASRIRFKSDINTVILKKLILVILEMFKFWLKLSNRTTLWWKQLAYAVFNLVRSHFNDGWTTLVWPNKRYRATWPKMFKFLKIYTTLATNRLRLRYGQCTISYIIICYTIALNGVPVRYMGLDSILGTLTWRLKYSHTCTRGANPIFTLLAFLHTPRSIR